MILALKSERHIWDISPAVSSRGFSSRENFGLIWQVAFKLEHLLFCQGRYDTFLEFKQTRWKVASDNYSRQFCKQTIIKLLLACSFRKMFIIGQNLKHVHVTYSFHEILIFFWLTLVKCFVLKFDFSVHQRNTILILLQKNNNKKNNKKPNDEIKTNRYSLSPVSDVVAEFVYQQILIFFCFMNLYLLKTKK